MHSFAYHKLTAVNVQARARNTLSRASVPHVEFILRKTLDDTIAFHLLSDTKQANKYS